MEEPATETAEETGERKLLDISRRKVMKATGASALAGGLFSSSATAQSKCQGDPHASSDSTASVSGDTLTINAIYAGLGPMARNNPAPNQVSLDAQATAVFQIEGTCEKDVGGEQEP